MKRTDIEQIELVAGIAAEWWSKVIRKPIFDNGETSISSGFGGFGGFGGALFQMGVQVISDEQIGIFKAELKEQITLEFIDTSSNRSIHIGSDYAPGWLLGDAFKKSLTPTSNCPIKTNMYISRDEVTVRYGYSAPSKTLYITRECLVAKIENDAIWIKDESVKLLSGNIPVWTSEQSIKENIAHWKECVVDFKAVLAKMDENGSDEIISEEGMLI